MATYESEHTKFMREWLEKHPEEIQVQKAGRALWWDKQPVDPAEQQRLKESKVPQKSYYYL
ncbi:MAG: DUF3460 domain-containing protein [Rhodocyclaceae bacterium]|jgi:hypothetical protein|nr:DUF3460 domain-containing protein [Rhodocyclaceae bacterium]